MSIIHFVKIKRNFSCFTSNYHLITNINYILKLFKITKINPNKK